MYTRSARQEQQQLGRRVRVVCWLGDVDINVMELGDLLCAASATSLKREGCAEIYVRLWVFGRPLQAGQPALLPLGSGIVAGEVRVGRSVVQCSCRHSALVSCMYLQEG